MAASDWRLEGEWMKNCTCAFGCPCDFNARPTQGYCKGLVAMWMSKGHFEGTRLDGLRFAIARPGTRGAFRMGLRHGSYCVGCCWFLMVLLFVGGVMNLAWIIGIALYVAAEKLLPFGQRLSYAAGALLILSGTIVVARAM
ncbi:DUF1326 domain-containing protein [Bradyrhizobium yuanmingense]|uniref:copper chaperone n=1 Tax=Bradyrhizobium yuanmingense TaxID=108015 RepID=UPI0012FAF1E4|nr:DUF1326 domain-containing protein [Bradyrhizobium yuanmingense]